MSSVAPLAIQIQTMQLEAAREHMTRAAALQSPGMPVPPAVQADAILELSAAAKQLIEQR